ncbi:hypothetical protein SK128_016655 [Halocaridina rubra]|uniref:Uncharacterized protein n=1 Tax=Halocaridina rubra TaxID=373956 RepID=A0AAN8WS73_HALRR
MNITEYETETLTDPISAICEQQFWNATLSWDGTTPDMGLCMERTVLLWSPCILLWILTPLQVLYLRHRGLDYLNWTLITYMKIVLSLLVSIAAVTELIWAIVLRSQEIHVPVSEFIAPSILLLTYILQSYLIILGKQHGERSSGIIVCFWTAMLLCGIPQFITTVISGLNQDDRLHWLLMVTFLIQYIGAIAFFIVNCFADNPPDSRFFSKSEKEFPEPYASFISQLTFHWANGLVWLGYKRPLIPDDLWDMPSKISTVHLDKRWDMAWRKQHASIP